MKAKTKKSAAKPEPQPLRGTELMRAVINGILENPKCWYQGDWHCGTQHCFGGWCQVRGGKPETRGEPVINDVKELLALSMDDAQWLCSGQRSFLQLYSFAESYIKGEVAFSRDGFSRDGFSRDGFDRDGFDRDGFDRDGFDRDGFSRDGFSRDGFSRAGTKLPLL